MGAIALAVVGAALIGGGMASSAAGARKKRKELAAAAEFPGINTGAETDAALTDIEGFMSRAEGIAGKTGTANQRVLNQLMEESMPGFAKMQEKRRSVIDDYLNGRLPKDVEAAISRSSAGQALARGPFGSNLHLQGEARQIGRTSFDLINLGLSESGRLASTMPMAQTPSVADFFGPTPTQRINLRSQERAQRLSILTQKAQMPTSQDVMGQGMQSTGGILLGAGARGMMGGGMGGMAMGGMSGAGGGGYQYPSGFSQSPGLGTGSTQIPGRYSWPGSSYGRT